MSSNWVALTLSLNGTDTTSLADNGLWSVFSVLAFAPLGHAGNDFFTAANLHYKHEAQASGSGCMLPTPALPTRLRFVLVFTDRSIQTILGFLPLDSTGLGSPGHHYWMYPKLFSF